MRTLRTLKPGQRGTKELLRRHGASLLCVRYRYDEEAREHLKTVELAVQRRRRDTERGGDLGSCDEVSSFASSASISLEGEAKNARSRKFADRAAAGARRRVALRIGLRERDLQRRVKSAGGRWDPDRRVWYLERHAAERLDLLHRVVGGGF